MLPAGSSTWRLVQAYPTNATYNWNTTGAPAGTEHFGVWVRDAGRPGNNSTYDTYVSIPYSLT